MDGINLKSLPTQSKKPRSSFDLSFKRMFDFKFGEIVPVLMQPVVADDEMSVSYQFLQRFAPFISQVFQDYKVKFDFYYVPNSLVYHNFELFMSKGFNGTTDYVHPFVDPSLIVAHCGNANYNHTIFDYLDLNPYIFGASPRVLLTEHWNAIPFAAYLQCYLDHCIGADTALNKLLENVMSKEFILDDGDNTLNLIEFFGRINSHNPDWQIPADIMSPDSLFRLPKCLYPLDYFTSGRTNPQLGPVMTIPLQLVSTDSDGSETFKLINSQSADSPTPLYMSRFAGSNQITLHGNGSTNNVTINASILNNVATINDFYTAAKIQELLTLYNYSGFHPSQRLAAEYGVKNPDSRMHRSEWLHSSIHDVSVGEVFSSNVNNASSSSGNMDVAGVGTAISATNSGDRGFTSYFTQHGFVVGFMSIIPEAAYSQGIPRIFSVADRFDYPHYALSEIGMAAIREKEIYATQGNEMHWNDTFSYMSQYGDYKVGINRVNGNLRQNLKFMNAGRLFGNLNTSSPEYIPKFNDEFLEVDAARNDLNRTFNVISTYPHECPILAKLDFRIYCKRQLPYYGLPRF